MKILFIIIGVVVIFGLLISSGGLAGGLCIKGVGCISTQQGGGGINLNQNDGPVTIDTNSVLRP